jgi:hypothetical protein
MKKVFFIVAGILLLLGIQTRANQASDFKLDKQKVQTEFSDLNQLEQTVMNTNLTLSEMQQKNMLTANFSNLNLANSMMMEPALGVPGFWWGCVLGPVGILAVYLLSEKDMHETKMAAIGCLVPAVVYTVYYLAVGASFGAL